MDLEDFKKLFIKNVRYAISIAEEYFEKNYPDEFEIELHGTGSSGSVMSIDNATNHIFISPDLFYKVIDIACHQETKNGKSLIFVRVSGHQPTTFDKTVNIKPGNGPFYPSGPVLN